MREAIPVGVAGLLIGIGLAVRLLVPVGWDPAVVGAFGEESEQAVYAEQVLGREATMREELGHDGRFFFILANDPWLAEPSQHARWLDRPVYRSQRILYPMLASGFGSAGPEAVLWGMLAVNVVALGVGSWATGLLVLRHGATQWWGLAFGLNPGMIEEFNIGGAGIVAFALAVVGVAALERGAVGLAAGVLAGAVLAREAMLLLVAGVVTYLLVCRRRVFWAVVAAPVLATGAWAGYLRWRLEGMPGGARVEEIGWPLVGLVEAMGAWSVTDWILGVVVWGVCGLLVVRAARRPSVLGWGAAGFIVLAVVFTRQVWVNYYDITRAIAPVFTAYVVVTFVERRGSDTVVGEREMA